MGEKPMLSAGWDFNALLPYLSENTILRLRSVVLDDVTGASDRLSWGESCDGNFTVKSAYNFITRDETPRQGMEKFSDRVWTLMATQRVRCFIWLVARQSIMVNAERHRRHLCDTNVCQVCNGGIETIIHTLRRKHTSFFGSSLLEWLYENLSESEANDGYPWATLFAVGVWWGWKWRCGDIFGGLKKCLDRVRFLRDMAKEVYEANKAVGGLAGNMRREERQIAWSPPSIGWVKLNTDGASRGNPGLATAGGVLRDGEGSWLGGFALHIGICSAPMAELWGVYYGLYIAWEKGINRVELEVDSEIVVGFLTIGISDSHLLSFLVRLCYVFISRDWLVRIRHVYREANRLADGLANYAFSLPLGFHALINCLDAVELIRFEDAMGISLPRVVPIV